MRHEAASTRMSIANDSESGACLQTRKSFGAMSEDMFASIFAKEEVFALE